MVRLIVFVAFLLPSALQAATYYARVASGDWNVAATWSTVAPGGAPATAVPGSNDDVVIERFSTTSPAITIPAGYTANAKTLRVGNNGQNGGVSLTFAAASSTLTMAGDVTIFPPNNATTNALNVNAGTMTAPTKLTLESGTGTARLQITTGTVTVTDNLELKGAAAANNVIDMSGGAGTLYISNVITVSATGTFTAGTTSTVNYNRAGAQTVIGGITYANLTLSGSGSKTLTGGTTNLAGNFTLEAGVTWAGNTNNPVLNIAGNFTNNGTFNSGTGTYTFNGSAAQTLTGTNAGTTTFTNLRLNNAAGLSLTGTHNVTVNTLLTLTSGRLTTNANVVFVANGSAISGAGANTFVVGNLRKQFGTGSDVTRVFEVGTDATGVRYAPVSIRFGSVTTAGTFTVSSTADDHPSIGSSTLDATQSVNRYWTLTLGTVVFTAHANNRIIFTFVNPGDLDGGVDTSVFYVGRFVSPTWTELTPSARTATTTTISGTGITTANVTGDYQIGEGAPAVPTPAAFNAFESSTAAGATTGVIRTKIAGTAFSLDVVAILAGAQLNGFTSQVTVELLGNNTLGVALDANNCPTSFTTVQTVSPNPTISGGRSAVNFAAVANSWRDVRVRVRYPTSSPTVTSCSTDNFAIRPNALASFAVKDTDWQTADPAWTGRILDDLTFTAGKTHKAGRPFSVRASAVNSASVTTNNYAGTPSASLSACGGAACTATFGTMTIGAAAVAGVLISDVATYDNVGAFRAQLLDSTFASVDAGDTAGDCTASGRYVCSAQLDVGRFVPDHFTVALNTPSFATACGTFTYLGQLFSYTTAPVITVTARDFAGAATTLYAGNWWRITNTTLTPNTDQAARYSAASGTLDVGSLPLVAVDPAIAASGNGVGTLTFSSGAGLGVARNTPVAPFDADIALAVNVIDADGIAHASNPATFGAATAGNGIAFSAGKAQRFGRMRLLDAVGSEKLDLPIPLRTEYWTGSGFATNTLDNCTSVTAKNFVLSNWQGGLNAGNMVTPTAGSNGNVSTSGGFASGIGSLTLLKPNPAAASPGSADVCLDLDPGLGGDATCQAVTPGDKTRLRTLRTNPPNTYTQDPFARAAFGVYGGQPASFIYQRENY
jgi:hypothetical protein